MHTQSPPALTTHLNLPNGTLHLATGILVPGPAGWPAAGVAYDPRAQCPTWERFVGDIMGGDPGEVARLRRAIAGAVAAVPGRRIVVLTGPPGSGKSALCHALAAVMGGYADEFDQDVLAGGGGRGLSGLMGLRMAFVECDNLAVLDGGMCRDEGPSGPTHTLFLACQDTPFVRCDDEDTRRRIELFTLAEPAGPPDRALPIRLMEEAPGILNWIVEGVRMPIEAIDEALVRIKAGRFPCQTVGP